MTMMNVATTQMARTWDLKHNLDQAERLVREAAVQIDSEAQIFPGRYARGCEPGPSSRQPSLNNDLLISRCSASLTIAPPVGKAWSLSYGSPR